MAPQTRTLSWAEASERCLAVRRAVFIEEQGIDPAIEIDGRDGRCIHALSEAEGRPIGTARMLPDGHIGRVAVLPAWRGQGIGQALMQTLCAQAVSVGLQSVHLASQESAVAFYRRLGFVAAGDVFIEAGIPHLNMSLKLQPWPY